MNYKELIDNISMDNHLSSEEIPDIDLYMDQVIQLFENKFAGSKRTEDEKVLTKTMINNYAKGKLFFPIKNKKYSKDHILLISIIYQLKGALSISDIKTTLDQLNKKIHDDDEYDLEQLYKSYLFLVQKNNERFIEFIQESAKEVEMEVEKLTDEDSEYLEQLLLVASLVNMSNLYRKAAERIVDGIEIDDED